MGNDFFQFKQFTIWQQHCAMKVGTDGTLLGAWAHGGNHILDIGTGTGLIALMMAQRYAEAHVVAIDIDAEAAGQARQNAAASPFGQRIDILLKDVAEMSGTFDAIVSNPPYFDASLKSPDAQRTLARHTDALPYRLLTTRSWQLLTDAGELSVIVPMEQKGHMESEAALAGFFKSRECLVKTSPRKQAKRCLLAFTKHPRQQECDILTIGTEPYAKLTKDFYL